MVDASHEDQMQQMPAPLVEFQKKQQQAQAWQMRVAPLMIHLGIARLAAAGEEEPGGGAEGHSR